MSHRLRRKLLGGNTLPPPEDDDSDKEFQPLYATRATPKNSFDTLVLSSHSDSEQESGIPVQSSPEAQPVKKKKHKNKAKKKVRAVVNVPDVENLDEIDKIVLEVNALLGTPPAAVAAPTPTETLEDVMSVNYKDLNIQYELHRMFGPEALEDGGPRRRGRQLNFTYKRTSIVPISENAFNRYNIVGLSMSVERQENGYSYFTYDHSKKYQNVHKLFLEPHESLMNLEPENRIMHIESMIEAADTMYKHEDFSNANTLIETVIAYLQFVAHPTFNLTNSKVRLEYKYLENRAFHIAVLKYLYALTTRACHRTALELAKLLMNLDPSDPLAVMFIIDTLAIRAREHEWLIKAIGHWHREREAGFLFNIQHSFALSKYHVAVKYKTELTEAGMLLQDSMLRFPLVFLYILKCANIKPSPLVANCPLFMSAEKTCCKALKELIYLYAKFTCSRWREPGVLEWMTRNADELVEAFKSNAELQKHAESCAKERLSLFRAWPNQVARHLCIIKPMASLILDGEFPAMPPMRANDPLPPTNTVDRCGYMAGPPLDVHQIISSLLIPALDTLSPDRYTLRAPLNENAAGDNENAGPPEDIPRPRSSVSMSVGTVTDAWRRILAMSDNIPQQNASTDQASDQSLDNLPNRSSDHSPNRTPDQSYDHSPGQSAHQSPGQSPDQSPGQSSD